MSSFPASTRQSKAIELPSGDHAGLPWKPTPVVRRTTFEPSGCMTYSSGAPLRVEEKAIFNPSGDQAGWPAAWGDSVVSGGFPDTSGLTTQHSTFPELNSYARRLPSRRRAE